MKSYLGIDVSKDNLEVVLLREGETAQAARFENTGKGFNSLHHFLKKRKVEGLHAWLEATGHYGDEVTRFLYEKGYTFSVVNPSRIKGYAQSRLSRNKTDGVDAALIADFCRTQQPDTCTPPAPEVLELQALLRHVHNLEAMRQQERNRLQAGLLSQTVLNTLNEHIAFLEQQIAALKQQIHDHCDQHPHLRNQRDLLTSISGLGDLTAFKLLAEIRDISAFQSARQLAPFAGLTPRQRTCASSIRGRSRLSKCGSARIRAALYFPAVVAMRFNPLLRPFAQRLLAAGKSKLQIIAAVMRKLLHLVFGILTSGQPFDPHYPSPALPSLLRRYLLCVASYLICP